MVLSERLSPEAIVGAMQAGRFYATTGVTLEEIAWDDEQLRVAVRAEEGVSYTVQFVGTLRDFDAESQPARDPEGKELADATRRYLDPDQVSSLAARRDLLVERIRTLIEERGEGAVLY